MNCQCSAIRPEYSLHAEFACPHTGEPFHVVYTPGKYGMVFTTFRRWNCIEWEPELSGSIRFDGCMNFSTNSETETHTCGRGYRVIGSMLDAVYELAVKNIEKWHG